MRTFVRSKVQFEQRAFAHGQFRPHSSAVAPSRWPQVVTQVKLTGAICHSSQQIAQRQQINRIFGPMAQPKEGLEEDSRQVRFEPVQRWPRRKKELLPESVAVRPATAEDKKVPIRQAHRGPSQARLLPMAARRLPVPVAIQRQPTVQRIDWSAVGLTGLGALIGTAVAPGIGTAIGAGIGGLLYGGYRYYRHRQRENTMNAIRSEQAGQTITAVNAVNYPSFANVNLPAPAQHLRTYYIDLNPNDPVGLGRTDPHLLRTAMLHERTHISGDMAYDANQTQPRGWMLHGDPNAGGFGVHLGQQTGLMTARLQTLDRLIGQDNALTARQRREMRARVNYALGQELREYDPVINELLAYTKEYGIRANSRAVKALVALARENLNRRRPGGPDLQGNWPA